MVVMGGHGMVKEKARGGLNDLGLQLLIILLLGALVNSFLLFVVFKLNKHYLLEWLFLEAQLLNN